MASTTKVLFLAMDAGDKFLIQKWAADGTLKTFGSLLERGLVGNTMSLEGFFEGSTWPSFYTGVAPGRHGFHRLVQLKPGTYEFNACCTGEFITHPPFWSQLSKAGRKVAVLDIPLSSITEDLGGIQMVEWGSHDPVYGFSTWPKTLKKEVLVRFGRYPVRGTCDAVGRTPSEFSVFRDHLIEGVRKKAMLTKYYLSKSKWDFFAQVFTESHCVGHQCWHLHEMNHPNHSAETVAIAGDPIRDVYVAIDEAIGEILKQIDDQTVVIILASHRMGYSYGAQFLLPDILIRLEAAQALSAEGQSRDVRSRIDTVLTWGWKHTPVLLKHKLNPIATRLRGKIHLPRSIAGLDFRKSRCFPLDNGLTVGGIRVNLAGREPNGMIRPGPEMDALCEYLIGELQKITYCDTGRPAIRGVKRTAELYQGDRLDHLPDILVEWNDEKPLATAGVDNAKGGMVRLFSERIGTVEGVNTYCRTGDHRPEGLFIAIGQGIEPGRLKETVSIMDFAPTFARLLGVPFPQADGRPIAEIVNPSTANP